MSSNRRDRAHSDRDTTVNVNNAIQAQLALSPSEIHYKKVGDKIVEQSGSALNWSVSNANSVSILTATERFN
jgi:hypothetical protein